MDPVAVHLLPELARIVADFAAECACGAPAPLRTDCGHRVCGGCRRNCQYCDQTLCKACVADERGCPCPNRCTISTCTPCKALYTCPCGRLVGRWRCYHDSQCRTCGAFARRHYACNTDHCIVCTNVVHCPAGCLPEGAARCAKGHYLCAFHATRDDGRPVRCPVCSKRRFQ